MESLDRAVQVLEEGVAQGQHPGAQLYVSRRGQVIADLALGEASPGVPMAVDSLTHWLSAGKPLLAVAAVQLWERGLLHLDQPVADIVPEFGVRGKDAITVRHVLTHTGGFRSVVDLYRGRGPVEELPARVFQARLERDWVPGRRAAYHILSGWFALGEVVARASGLPVCEYVRRHVLLPAGMEDSWLRLPDDGAAGYGDRLAGLYDTSRGRTTPRYQWLSAAGAPCVPGAGARGPARQLGRLYEALLAGGEGVQGRVLGPAAVEAMVARHRVGLCDETFDAPMDWGLGVIADNKHYGDPAPYGYGPHASPRAFGHGGNQSSVGYADPEHGLVVAAVVNGMPGPEAHQQRFERLNRAIWEDLGVS